MGGVTLEKAALYEKYRLPYAPEAVDDLLQHVGTVHVIADVGSGTGQLARLLAGRCTRLFAIEPDASMRTVARAALSRWPTVEIVEATAEGTTLPTASVDQIVVGNAFHRFRPGACGELRRILREEGWVALFSYSFTDPAFTDLLFSRLSTLEPVASKITQSWHSTPVECRFGDCQTSTLTYRQSQAETWEAFFGVARAGIEAPGRGDAGFARFEQVNREVFEALSADGRITVHYETSVVFGQPNSIHPYPTPTSHSTSSAWCTKSVTIRSAPASSSRCRLRGLSPRRRSSSAASAQGNRATLRRVADLHRPIADDQQFLSVQPWSSRMRWMMRSLRVLFGIVATRRGCRRRRTRRHPARPPPRPRSRDRCRWPGRASTPRSCKPCRKAARAGDRQRVACLLGVTHLARRGRTGCSRRSL